MSDPAPAAPAAVVPASDAELPRSIVKRLIKGKLDELAAKLAGPDGKRHDYQISKDALIAFCESAKVFISYLAATANDICKESKRATVSGDDVLQALDDMDFGEFAEPLKEYMQEHKAALQERLVKKGAYKKRKAGSDQPGGSAAAAAAVAAGAGDGGDADEEEDAGAGGAGANDGGEQQGDVPMAEAGTV